MPDDEGGKPMGVMRKTRLLPLFLLFTAGLMLVKAGTVFSSIMGLQAGAAVAQEKPAETPDYPDEEIDQDSADESASAGATIRAPRDLDRLNRTEFQLLQELRQRRQTLDERERQLELQQTLLQAKEQQISQKIGRLEALEQSIAALVEQYDDQEDAQLKDLVQIYETMKAKDAARIFDQLALETQLDLARRINPRKMSAILAEMASDQARVLTTELAKHESLEEALSDDQA